MLKNLKSKFVEFVSNEKTKRFISVATQVAVVIVVLSVVNIGVHECENGWNNLVHGDSIDEG
jgi:hypothetical protein